MMSGPRMNESGNLWLGSVGGVADEFKENGSAEARQFDEVTCRAKKSSINNETGIGLSYAPVNAKAGIFPSLLCAVKAKFPSGLHPSNVTVCRPKYRPFKWAASRLPGPILHVH